MQPLSTLHPTADPTPVACKICKKPSPLFGVIDFHKSCVEAKGKRLSLSGYPVYYRRCTGCGFLFTTAFDQWTHADFSTYIYNADYLLVDPDFVAVRPLTNAALIASTFRLSQHSIRILDYGGGMGLVAEQLRSQGFSATTYDPFTSFNALPSEPFDLISCFEVLEHVPFPAETVATMVSLLKRSGAILFSTLLQPTDIESIGLNWWYAGPRNGHLSLYTKQSLASLFAPHGLHVGSFSDVLHIAYAEVPPFAMHLFLPSASAETTGTRQALQF